jgi:predicted metal-dependent HD superfamily phosphohydrolase
MITFTEIRDTLQKWEIHYTWYEITKKWSETHRFYHTLEHLMDLLDQIERKYPKPSKERDKLVITALFHDIIYNPTRGDNEEKSAKFFLAHCKEETDDIYEIYDMILATKTHESESDLSKIFNDMDMDIVTRNFDELMVWEEEIREEYGVYTDEEYREGILTFLRSLINKYPQNKENLLNLIDWVNRNY